MREETDYNNKIVDQKKKELKQIVHEEKYMESMCAPICQNRK